MLSLHLLDLPSGCLTRAYPTKILCASFISSHKAMCPLHHNLILQSQQYWELKITPILDKLLEYKRNWIQHLNRMPCNRLPRVMKHCSPTGRRNHGRPLKRLLDTWDRNGSTSGPTPWQIYDDDDIIVHLSELIMYSVTECLKWTSRNSYSLRTIRYSCPVTTFSTLRY